MNLYKILVNLFYVNFNLYAGFQTILRRFDNNAGRGKFG